MAKRFEIMAKSGSRWSLHSYDRAQDSALKTARGLLKQKVAEEIKVVLTEDGDELETIFHENYNSKKAMGIGFIETLPPCAQASDLYEPKARQSIILMLKDYCDQNALSPLELLHHERAIGQFLDSTLATSAFSRAATLQAPSLGVTESARQDTLFQMAEEIRTNARMAPRRDIAQGGFLAFLQDLGDLESAQNQRTLWGSLALALERATSWENKYALLAALIGELEDAGLEPKSAQVLDDYLSEVLALPTALQDMLGHQPDRNNVLRTLAKVCTGRYEPTRMDTKGMHLLSGLCQRFPMSGCRAALSKQMETMLKSRSALTRGDVHEEKYAFKELLPLFIARNGTILGGESMAASLTICGVRCFNRDRSLENPEEAIRHIVERLQVPLNQVKYLLDLAKTQFGQDCGTIIAEFLPAFMAEVDHVHDMVNYKAPLLKKLRAISSMQKAAMGLKLKDDLDKNFVSWLDGLLYTYLDEERVIDRMDNPEDTLFKRTTTLLQFCASGVLVEGPTLQWVRKRVQEHLRQPNFVEKFTEDVPTAKKRELVIAQLHAMLKKAGLQA